MLILLEEKLVGPISRYERAILRRGAVWFFFVLASYYILRPIREQISSTYGIRNLSWLFWATFGAMLVAIPLYSALVARVHRRRLVPAIYSIFIVSLLLFCAALHFYADWTLRDVRLGETPSRVQVSIFDGGRGETSLTGMSLRFTAADRPATEIDLGGATDRSGLHRVELPAPHGRLSLYRRTGPSTAWFGPRRQVSRLPDEEPQYQLVDSLEFQTDANGHVAVTSHQLPSGPQVWIARVLFIWISIYGLFIVSFFWSVVGDMLTTEQGRKVFGMMAGGGTIGGMVGSLVAAQLVDRLGIAKLLLFPALFLLLGGLVYWSLERTYQRLRAEASTVNSGKATGGNPFAGFTAVFRSRYLLAICIFGLFLATCGTTIYFQQAEIVRAAIQTEEARTRYFANVNLAVSIVTLVFQFVVVGWLMNTIGLGWTLALLPLTYIAGISALALSPTLAVMAVISVTGRSAEYGICNPSREVLFTAVKREDRYKAKSFIDTVVRRAGDSTIGSVYHALRGSLGFAMSTLSWLALPIALLWTILALYIGHLNRSRTERPAE